MNDSPDIVDSQSAKAFILDLLNAYFNDPRNKFTEEDIAQICKQFDQKEISSEKIT